MSFRTCFFRSELSHDVLEVGILALEFLQALGFSNPEAAVFLLPAVVSLLGDAGCLQAAVVLTPWAVRTSISRSLVTICSGVKDFFGILSSLVSG